MDPPPPPVDLLSSLPEHLQEEILTRLGVRNAVRTSALSRAWRRRWERVPGLDLTFPNGTPASVVDRVLLRYRGPRVSRFACDVDGEEDDVDASASHVSDWLMELSRRSVESISIGNHEGTLFTVHSSIFSCQRLVSLSLEQCRFPPFPRQHGGLAGEGLFPVLKDLHLRFVVFADNGERQLRAMIRASPMLRVLALEDVEAFQMDCMIEATNLHTMQLISCSPSPFGELPRLQYASINMKTYRPGGHASFVEFLAGLSKVRDLIFNLPLCDFEMHGVPFTFSNLKSMELSSAFADMKCVLLMFCLLRSSPNLEKLKIEIQFSKVDVAHEFLNAQWTDGMCANLGVVEITSHRGWLPLSFMKLILSKASLLRTLSMDKCPVSQYDQLNELLNCRRASPQAQVLFKVQLEEIKFDRLKFGEKRLI